MEELEVIKASFNKYSINSKINFDYKINGNRLEFSGHTFEFMKRHSSIEGRCLSMSYVVAIFDDYYSTNFDSRLLASIRFNPCFDDSCNDIKCNSIVLYSCRSAIYFCKSNNYNPENLICLTRDKELAKKKYELSIFQ